MLWTVIARKKQISKFHSRLNYCVVVHNTPAEVNDCSIDCEILRAVSKLKLWGTFGNQIPPVLSLKFNLGAFITIYGNNALAK